LSALERFYVWFVTGPVGRVIAFFGDLGAALGGWALRRLGLSRNPENPE
jgi:hypothetical protein